MNFTQETVKLLMGIIGTLGFGTGLTLLLNRKKTKAETESIIAKTYSDMIDNLRKQVESQGEQIRSLEDRQTQYLKMINESLLEKKRLIQKHARVERDLNERIKKLELKLSTYIKNN